MWNTEHIGPYQVVPFRPERNATLDTLRWAKKRLQVPILVEVDVSAARKAIREFRRNTGSGLSFTAWIVSCVARAAAEHPRVHEAVIMMIYADGWRELSEEIAFRSYLKHTRWGFNVDAEVSLLEAINARFQ